MQAGEQVTIQVRNPLWPRRAFYASHQPEFFSFTGMVVSNARWVGPDHVSLTTGDPRFPVRVIPLEDVVGSEHLAIKAATKSMVWQVAGSKGSKYTVTQDKNQFSCTCAGFGFRRHCRHVDELKWKLKEAA